MKRSSILKSFKVALFCGILFFNFSLSPKGFSTAPDPECEDCLNGCLTYLGTCCCYGTHAYKEADWGD